VVALTTLPGCLPSSFQIGMVIAAVIGIFLFRQISNSWSEKGGPYITSAMNAIQIQVLNAKIR
jgi:hypothetical protein